MNKYGHRCGCQGGVCGIQYSSLDQFDACPISSPYEWPELLQVPRPLRVSRHYSCHVEICICTIACGEVLLVSQQSNGLYIAYSEDFMESGDG
ncbi:hypothetical protein GW17_00013760 [Ensete ventricosum]|uniref:Uncharacterized protein n=1 Tax=Ensete ventricosum TaxID=4639 RepID=A0A427B3J5_ENSVE|nr:hypothetical protein B296_00003901 [Ensete ventricosum]RWW22060.1 hypothetical protein GW17_00013760 [Ensete ventricosum]